MSHDTDKLIRQLSLVAFLMAERRPLTARDVKSNVEGYSEMSDEAFARRFYSDRAELIALGVPLHSQRDEFTGEELYTLRSEQYFLPPLELSDEELAALQTYLYARERDFRVPAEFEIDLYRNRPTWQIGDIVGEARIDVARDTAWWVERAFGSAGTVEDGTFVTDYAGLGQLASWVLRQDGRAIPI